MNRDIWSSDGQINEIERRPEETLHDYLVRRQWEMGGRIRLLEAVRDGQEMFYFDARARWHRHMILLAIGEAAFAIAGYILLDYCAVPTRISAPMTAMMIGLCALLGAVVAIVALAMRERLVSWTGSAWRQAKDYFWEVMTSGAAVPDSRTMLAGIDASRPETIDTVVEKRVAQHLEVETFLWRSRMMIAQLATIVVLFAAMQIARGVSFQAVIDDSILLATVCLFGGGLLLFAADCVNTNLARLGRWWRSR